MSSKVGGIARAPVWGANLSYKIIAEVATTTSYCCAQRGLATSWFGGDSVANDRGSSTSVSPSRSDTDSRCYLVFTRCLSRWEAERLCKFVSLVMFVPGEHYISGALQAQSSSAYSSSTDEG